ncbi:precorrin-3B synthase [Xanthobacter sp. V4C-4]|uniref:precorrin-3B synthase n=1 Tax=Xanthobacter cornucopiae TaxID=3119924 RepID=UPI00372B3A94
MKACMDHLARGWCPGVARPMATGDGLLARVHPPHGILSPAQARGLAAVSVRCGNGMVDITSHGNLQLRGLTPATQGMALAALAALGLADPAPRPPYRATVVSPLAGLDPLEATDGLVLAQAVEEMARAIALPPKFLIAIDSGGAFGLDALAPDVWVRAQAAGTLRLGLGGDSVPWTPPLPRAALDTALPALLRAIAAALSRHGARRAHAMPAAARQALMPGAQALHLPSRAAPAAGAVMLKGGTLGLLAAAPFGQMPAAALAGLADAAARHGLDALRLTPRRGVLLPGLAPADLEPARADIAALGLVTDPADPRLRVITCPGAPACAAGLCQTHPLATRLAAALPPGDGEVHLSACAKGCARRGASALTLVARDDAFAVIGNGGPLDPPLAILPFAEIARRLAGAAALSHAFHAEAPRHDP